MATKGGKTGAKASAPPAAKTVAYAYGPAKSVAGGGLRTAKSVAHGFGTARPVGMKSTVNINNQVLAVAAAAKPTPYEFDLFVAWLSLMWEVPYTVTVTKDLQAEYISVLRSRKPSKTRRGSGAPAKGGKGKLKKDEKPASDTANTDQFQQASPKLLKQKILTFNYDEESSPQVDDSQVPSITEIEIFINLTAYYDHQDNLVELTIEDTEADLPKKLIHVLIVCAPFHNSLYKLTIRKIGLRTSAMSYLATYIQQSYLTDLILDDTKLTNIDFHVIFDATTPLKHVSLARCKLGDDTVVLIAARLCHNQRGSKSLAILNLTGNRVEDRGARALAHMLRTNRQLSHLNLAQNQITDDGASAILDSLQEFPLSYEEFVSSRARRMEYCAQKHVIYKSCLDEILEQRSGKKGSPKKSNSPKRDSPKSRLKASPDTKGRKDDPQALADEMARGILGEFNDPYDTLNMVKKDKYRFCIGNKRLCCLNLSYNDLYFPTLLKILEVLEWQKRWPQPPFTQQPTGLIRLVLDGNAFPMECDELFNINRILTEKTVFGSDYLPVGRLDSSLHRGKKSASAKK